MLFRMLICIILMEWCSTSSVAGRHGDCSVVDDVMACEQTLPDKIQENATSVVVRDYQGSSIIDVTFTDISWKNVSSLDLTVNGKLYFRLKRNNFIKLKTKLTYLGIHAPRLKSIDRDSFQELTNLQILDLSLSMYINDEQLVRSLMESQLRLTSLNLSCISPARALQMDQSFMQMISETKTERLNLSGTNLILKGPLNITNLKFELVYLDLSNTSIAISDISHRSVMKALKHFTENLKELDLSYINSMFLEVEKDFLQNNNKVLNCSTFYFYQFIGKVQNVFLNGIFQSKVYGNNSNIVLTACSLGIKNLYLKDNNIVYLNATIKWPKQNHFKTMELSGNHMEYLNPEFFTGLASLESMDLSDNKLRFMETLEDFSLMFTNFHELRYCNMSNNKLTFIPKHMFKNNAKMVKLDLSNNDLTTVAFDIDQLKVIQVLRLMNNRIKVLMEKDFMSLNVLLQLHNASVPDIDLTGNPLECTCKSKKFLEWLSNALQPRTKRLYMCQMDGQKHSVDETAIEQVKYLCIRNTIIISSVCGSTVTVMSIVFVAAFILLRYRKKKRKQTMANFLFEIRTGRFAEHYLCFLSFSSNEDQELIDEINGSIDRSLEELTGKQDKRICVGDSDFRPGYHVVNEIFRVVNDSYVMVCLVSRAFCVSRWCEWELRVAFESRKPIILIFTEEVPENEMPTILHHVYNTQTRAKVLENNGQYSWIPNCDRLCEVIVEHAFNRYVTNEGTPNPIELI